MINNKISEKQRERFELIETIAYWERSLNANILKQFLRLTWNMAIKELGVYKELHPKTFEYNQSLRYLPPMKALRLFIYQLTGVFIMII